MVNSAQKMHTRPGCCWYIQPEGSDGSTNFLASDVRIMSACLTCVFIWQEFKEKLFHPKHYKTPHRKNKYDTKQQCLIIDL